jgi:polysaccharide deacetylase family protein (PEP-CTERM system associated)
MVENKQKKILLTIDVEDWFQVENFKPWIPFSTWDSLELRVEKNTHRLLDLFDSIEITVDRYIKRPKATFFILGWIAKRIPHLVKLIHNRGHEVASHGFNHNLCTYESFSDLKSDLSDSKKILEDITGSIVSGYRAPNFSISHEVLNAIQECGYLYDSSYNSFNLNPRYGRVDFNGCEKIGIAIEVSENFYELPLSNLRLGNLIIPLSGGGYFRLFPSIIFNRGVRSILNKKGAYLFYMHPWEFDPKQPKVKNASSYYKLRHYINIEKTELKLINLIQRFKQSALITCSQYVEEVNKITL